MRKVNFRRVLSALFGLLLFLSAYTKENQDNFHEKFLNYKEYKIHYELYGNRHSEKTLVFIHGWCSNIDVWVNQLDEFPDYKVIAIDLPGHGKSSKDIDAEYTITLFANSINAVLVNEEVEKAFIFGHSMGFAVSEVFALKYPEKTIGIGSIDGAHFEVENDEKSQNDWIAYNSFMAESLNEEIGRENFINMLFLPETSSKIKSDILEKSKTTPLPIGKKIIASMSNEMSYWNKRVVNIPCFVIHSPVYQLTEDYKDDFKKMYPEVDYHEMEGVSHFLMLEVPEQLNHLMHSYLKKEY